MPGDYEDFVKQSHWLLGPDSKDPRRLGELIYRLIQPPIGTNIPAEAGDAEDQPLALDEVQRRLGEAQRFFRDISQSATVNNVKTTINPPLALETATPTPTPTPAPPPPRPEEPPVRIEVNPQPLPSQPFLTTPFLPSPPPVSVAPLSSPPFAAAPPVATQPLAYSRPDLYNRHLPDVDWTVPIPPVKPFQHDDGGGGILGKITGGSGNKYTCDLYENGAHSPATQSGVTVFIPQIDSTDDIPDNTWVAPIIQVTAADGTSESWYQPPVWLA